MKASKFSPFEHVARSDLCFVYNLPKSTVLEDDPIFLCVCEAHPQQSMYGIYAYIDPLKLPQCREKTFSFCFRIDGAMVFAWCLGLSL